MKFYLYLRELRQRKFKDTRKLCLMLGVSKDMWRKLERGINPPPRRSVLRKFCILVMDSRSKPEWKEALMAQNRPDYAHKYWKPLD